MDHDFEEFCDACKLMGSARRSFGALAANEPENPADIRMLARALNKATYRYLTALSKLREPWGRD